MSMGWYLIPRSSMASSRAPTTNRASCLSVWGKRGGNVFAVACTTQSGRRAAGTLTSVGVSELGAAEEAQVARPGPDRLGVSETEPGVEVVGLEDLLAVTAVVAAAVVSAVHPDLQERANQQWRKKTRTSVEQPSSKKKYSGMNLYTGAR